MIPIISQTFCKSSSPLSHNIPLGRFRPQTGVQGAEPPGMSHVGRTQNSGHKSERRGKWLFKHVCFVRSRGIVLEIFQFEFPLKNKKKTKEIHFFLRKCRLSFPFPFEKYTAVFVRLLKKRIFTSQSVLLREKNSFYFVANTSFFLGCIFS
jgi:hypothetical protein